MTFVYFNKVRNKKGGVGCLISSLMESLGF